MSDTNSNLGDVGGGGPKCIAINLVPLPTTVSPGGTVTLTAPVGPNLPGKNPCGAQYTVTFTETSGYSSFTPNPIPPVAPTNSNNQWSAQTTITINSDAPAGAMVFQAQVSGNGTPVTSPSITVT